MLLTSIRGQDDESKPHSLFTQLLPEEVPSSKPLLKMKCKVNPEASLQILQFFEDRIINKTEIGHFNLFLDDGIGFEANPEKMKLTFYSRENGASETFSAESQPQFSQSYSFLRTRCSQRDFHRKYSLEKREGGGKNGQVHQIIRIEDKTTFAAKIQTYSGKLRDQLSILRQLHHPNLIYFHEYFIQPDHQIYIILDHENGGNLLSILTKNPHLSSRKKVKIVTDMLNALQFLRIKGIVHRDLKLQNILYSTTDGNYKICDFGLAVKTNTKYTKIVGTPGYLAPQLFEKGDSKVTDILSDIYSMGLIFFQIFSGSQFYTGSSSQQLLVNNAKGKSYRWEEVGQMNKQQKQLLRLMIRSKKEKRMNSYQILKSGLFSKITKVYGLDIKSNTTSPSKSNKGEEEWEPNLLLTVKELLRIRSCEN